MSLVAHALQELERRVSWASRWGSGRPGSNTSSIRLARGDDARALLDQRTERPQASPELPLAAIDHKEIGPRGKGAVAGGIVRRAIALALPLRDAPLEHLVHRGEVVGLPLLKAANLEAR